MELCKATDPVSENSSGENTQCEETNPLNCTSSYWQDPVNLLHYTMNRDPEIFQPNNICENKAVKSKKRKRKPIWRSKKKSR